MISITGILLTSAAQAKRVRYFLPSIDDGVGGLLGVGLLVFGLSLAGEIVGCALDLVLALLQRRLLAVGLQVGCELVASAWRFCVSILLPCPYGFSRWRVLIYLDGGCQSSWKCLEKLFSVVVKSGVSSKA